MSARLTPRTSGLLASQPCMSMAYLLPGSMAVRSDTRLESMAVMFVIWKLCMCAKKITEYGASSSQLPSLSWWIENVCPYQSLKAAISIYVCKCVKRRWWVPGYTGDRQQLVCLSIGDSIVPKRIDQEATFYIRAACRRGDRQHHQSKVHGFSRIYCLYRYDEEYIVAATTRSSESWPASA